MKKEKVENMINIMQHVEKIKEYETINICFYLCLCVILVSAYLLVVWPILFHISASNKASKKWWGSLFSWSMSSISSPRKAQYLAQDLNEISIPIPSHFKICFMFCISLIVWNWYLHAISITILAIFTICRFTVRWIIVQRFIVWWCHIIIVYKMDNLLS